MKPAAFEYHAPRSRTEALALLASYGDETRVLAGGQSLVPAMNSRQSRPRVLLDLNRMSEMTALTREADGALSIGAMVRQRTLERASSAWEYAPALQRSPEVVRVCYGKRTRHDPGDHIGAGP